MAQLTTLAPLLPELVLTIGAMLLLVLGVSRPESKAQATSIGWMAIGLMAVAAWLAAIETGRASLFNGAVIVDDFARFMKILALIGAAGALMLAFDELAASGTLRFEYPILLLLATVGMLLMISAGDLMALYLGLELQSLALYVVAAFRRDHARSSEAGLKYFVLGALSSGMLLYGASMIYGFAGTTTFAGIAKAASAPGAGQNLILIFGLVFLLVGVAFKISAVPFHMWTPDVYEGAPTPVTAFLAAAPKVAAMALLVRVVATGFPAIKPQWQQIIVFLSIASMLLGALAAIGQTNIKRLMAYSSIANMGYALVGLAAGTAEGIQGVLVYLAIYVVMTLGAFACILSMRRNGEPVETIEELAGLSQTNRPMAFALAMFMFSLAGIPPLAGFFAKWYVFLPAIKAGFVTLAVVGVLASVVGAYYYLRVVKVMFFDEPKTAFERAYGRERLVMILALIFVLVFVAPFVAAPMVEAAGAAARSLM
ncbi:MAG: NADH-quinone oxidoreductase subunit NuoN [Hyphomicrobiaceae bacterium]